MYICLNFQIQKVLIVKELLINRSICLYTRITLILVDLYNLMFICCLSTYWLGGSGSLISYYPPLSGGILLHFTICQNKFLFGCQAFSFIYPLYNLYNLFVMGFLRLKLMWSALISLMVGH